MIKYRTDLGILEIHAVVYISETPESVNYIWKEGVMNRRKGNPYHKISDTFEEAKEHLAWLKTEEIGGLEKRLEVVKNQLNKINEMVEPSLAYLPE